MVPRLSTKKLMTWNKYFTAIGNKLAALEMVDVSISAKPVTQLAYTALTTSLKEHLGIIYPLEDMDPRIARHVGQVFWLDAETNECFSVVNEEIQKLPIYKEEKGIISHNSSSYLKILTTLK